MAYDFVIVGSGLFGSTVARLATDAGRKCIVFEKRDHIGGLCYSDTISQVPTCKFGIHAFHTSDAQVWEFVNRFGKWRTYEHRVKAMHQGKVYSFPVNLLTLQQVAGYIRCSIGEPWLAANADVDADTDAQTYLLDVVGKDLYQIFFHGYTKKQWGVEPQELPASIVKRIPVRMTFDDRYCDDYWQAIPEGGYTPMFEAMLDGVEVQTNTDFFGDRKFIESLGQVVFTGEIDRFFEYRFGPLDYRCLRFDTAVQQADTTGAPQMNYTEECVPWTRIIEHRHLYGLPNPAPVTYEYPASRDDGVLCYPGLRADRYAKYAALPTNAVFGGRLATFSYLDMDDAIRQAMNTAEALL